MKQQFLRHWTSRNKTVILTGQEANKVSPMTILPHCLERDPRLRHIGGAQVTPLTYGEGAASAGNQGS